MARPASERHLKNVEPLLAVLADVRGTVHLAGLLVLHSATREQFSASFTYHPAYLALGLKGEVFPLDPVNLPFSPQPFTSSKRYTCLGGLFDAAPDAWGRTVMANDEKVSALSLSESQVLLKGRGGGVGAILFAPVNNIDELDQELWQVPEVAELASTLPHEDQIPLLYETVQAIERGVEVSEELRDMLSSSWDMGGARPKAVVRDAAGDEWIVKFPRSTDQGYSRQRVEWANLEMARAIGIRVPEIRLVELDDGDAAFLVRRFDRKIEDEGNTHRLHFLSAVALISPPADWDKRDLDTPRGQTYFSYLAIANIARRIASNYVAAAQELYARMILNILVHNCDDHAKNTGFIMDPRSGDFRYELSPLYDVVTQADQTLHMLHIGPGIDNPTPAKNGRVGSLENARAGAREWGLKPYAVEQIIEAVSSVVANRRKYYEAAAMKESEIAHVEHWISGSPLP